MGLNKNGKLILLFFTILLISASAFMVTKLMSNNITKIEEKETEQAKKTGYENLIKELYPEYDNQNLKVFLSTRKALVVPKELTYKTTLPFEYIIQKNGIKIINANSYHFYEYPFEVDTLITKINDQEVVDLEYFQIVELLFQDVNSKIKLTLSDGTEIDYVFKNSYSEIDYDESKTRITFNLKNMHVNYDRIYDLAKDKETVVFNISNAHFSNFEDMRSFLSIFLEKDTILYGDYRVLNSYKLKNKSITINWSGNQDSKIAYAMGILGFKNSSIKFNRITYLINNVDYFEKLENDTHIIYYQTKLIKKGSAAGEANLGEKNK